MPIIIPTLTLSVTPQMPKYSAIWLILGVVLACGSSQKAILIDSSLGYYNYRQVSNILKVYQHLKANGFRDDDILLLIGEMTPCCQKNHFFSSISFYDSDYTNIFRNVEVDYWQSSMTASLVSNLIMGFYSNKTLNKRKLVFEENEPFLIYLTGHGGDKYIKIRERQALTDEQFPPIFKTLISKNITGMNAVISDSCGAITPFEKVKTHNFIALGSSSMQQKSQSHGQDPQLNMPKSDDFTYYFDEVLNKQTTTINRLSSLDEWTFNDLFKYMDITKLKVNSKLVSSQANKNQKISNFVKRKPPHVQFKKYSNGNAFNEYQVQFFNH